MDNEVIKPFQGCLILCFIGLCFVFPILFIFLVPFGIYVMYKQSEEKEARKKLHDIIEQKLLGLDLDEVEKMRIQYIMLSQNPLSSAAEIETAKYIVKYIEDKYWGTKQLKKF